MAVVVEASAVSSAVEALPADGVVPCGRYIESELRRARRQLKLLDLACGVMSMAVAALAFLMLAAAADHWLFPGGLNVVGRAIAFSLLVLGAAVFVGWRLFPLVVRRVNPVFAGYTIECHRPQLKNSLVNLLSLRCASARLPRQVYEMVESQAATALARSPNEAAVDCSPMVRWLTVFAALVLFTAVYMVAAPKSLFTSWRRIVEPWANIDAPTRVRIGDVRPGHARICHGQTVLVSADVRGLRADDAVSLVYSTVDGQLVRRASVMTLPPTGYLFEAPLPADGTGLQQDVEYWIEAGDAVSPPWRVNVEAAPAIVIERVDYEFPRYTKLAPRAAKGNGDLAGLDGTRVKLIAKANRTIREASVDFGCDDRHDLPMSVNGNRATVEITLNWNSRTDRPEHENYQLLFSSAAGEKNPEPIRYAIAVTRDLGPKVEIVEPHLDARKELVATSDQVLRFEVRAEDPDFGLAAITFHAAADGVPLVNAPLLAETTDRPVRREYRFDLAKVKRSAGESIEVWAAAEDNRLPQPNQVETPHYRIRLAAGDNDSVAQPPTDKDSRIGSNSESNVSGNREATAPETSKQKRESAAASHAGAETKPSGQQRQERAAQERHPRAASQPGSAAGDAGRIDPERAPGRAMEEVSNFFHEQKQKGKGDRQHPPREDRGEKPASPPQEAKAPEHQPKPSPTDAMSEGGPQAQNAEQSTAGKKEDGLEATSRQSGGNQGGDNSAAAAQQDNVGSRSSGGTQKDRGKPDTGQPDGGERQPQARFQRGMKQHDGGQSGETEKPSPSGLDDRPGDKVEPHRGDHPMPADLAKPSTSDANGQRHQGENSHRRGGMSGEDASRHQPQKQMPDGVAGKGEHRPKNEAASEQPKEMKAKLGDDMPKNADGLKAPKPGQGENVRGSGDPNEKENADSQENFDDYKGGDPYTNDKGDAGAGEQGTNHQGSPPPQEQISQVRDKKQLSPDGRTPKYDDEPDAPAKEGHNKQSDSKSNMKGDRQGGGKSGGGQRSESQGTGSAGQNTAANQGGGQSDQQGGGPTGTKGGDRTKANQPTGGKPSGEQGAGSHRQAGKTRVGGADNAFSPDAADPRGHSNDAPQQLRQKNMPDPRAPEPKARRPAAPREPPVSQPAARQQPDAPRSPGQQSQSVQPGGQAGGGNSNPSGGGIPGADLPAPRGENDDTEPGGDEANVDYARRVTNLALARLKDQLANDSLNAELLDRLKWTRADVERFVAQWDRLNRATDESGWRGDSARRELAATLRNLALRAKGAALAGGKRDDLHRNARAGRRVPPPPEYAEQWREFNKGLGAGARE